jgi:acyl-CoA hydrolase
MVVEEVEASAVETMDNQQEANCLSVITRAIDSEGEKSRAAIDLRIGQSGIGACSNYLLNTIRQGALELRRV